MSIYLTNEVWQYSTRKGSELLLLLALADHANEQGVCWPSVRHLARKCRLSPRQVRRLIEKLVESGELAVEQGGGRRFTNIYHILELRGRGRKD